MTIACGDRPQLATERVSSVRERRMPVSRVRRTSVSLWPTSKGLGLLEADSHRGRAADRIGSDRIGGIQCVDGRLPLRLLWAGDKTIAGTDCDAAERVGEYE